MDDAQHAFTVMICQQYESFPKIVMCSNHFDSSVLKILAGCVKSQQKELFHSLPTSLSLRLFDALGTSEIRSWAHKTQWKM